MFSLEVHYLVSKEKYKDLRRDAARHQLIQTARLRRPDKRESLWKMVSRIGSQLMTWGSKPKRYVQGQHQTLIQY